MAPPWIPTGGLRPAPPPVPLRRSTQAPNAHRQPRVPVAPLAVHLAVVQEEAAAAASAAAAALRSPRKPSCSPRRLRRCPALALPGAACGSAAAEREATGTIASAAGAAAVTAGGASAAAAAAAAAAAVSACAAAAVATAAGNRAAVPVAAAAAVAEAIPIAASGAAAAPVAPVHSRSTAPAAVLCAACAAPVRRSAAPPPDPGRAATAATVVVPQRFSCYAAASRCPAQCRPARPRPRPRASTLGARVATMHRRPSAPRAATAVELREQAAEVQVVREELRRFELSLAAKLDPPPSAPPAGPASYSPRAGVQRHTSKHWMELERLPDGSWRTFRVYNAAALCEVTPDRAASRQPAGPQHAQAHVSQPVSQSILKL